MYNNKNIESSIVLENKNESELKRYHCSCGKMLFKGLLFLSMVEIKCKRCSNICRFCDLYSKATGPYSFAFVTDKDGIITETTYSARDILGHDSSTMVGKSIFDMCPKLKDTLEEESYKMLKTAGKHFEIIKNKFAQRWQSCPGKKLLYFELRQK